MVKTCIMNPIDIIAAEGLPAVRIITPRRITDSRGFFSEVWRLDAMANCGIDVAFVQENHALSAAAGTIRGMHFQAGKAAQAKLVRCPRGSVFDVAVDVRRGSPTFGRHVAVVLSARNWQQIYIPAGFAHGYCTLEPDTEVLYKVSAYYDPVSEHGFAWNDSDVAIPWPVSPEQASLSAKDLTYPPLSALPDFFPDTGSADGRA
jgi:dTDP-4-dehydrorhamnose 3,5-epimerase